MTRTVTTHPRTPVMSSPLPHVRSGPTLFDRQIGRPGTTPPGPRIMEAGIPVRDGVELAADVYLPAPEQLPAPVVLTMTPYGKSTAGEVDPAAAYFQAHGYVAVVVDCRGRGKSEGRWLPGVHDAHDGHDAVEWAATRPWSTGRVGMTGHSYAGWAVWAAASERPEGLRCMVSSSPIGAWQQEMPYNNGVLQLNTVWWLAGVRRRIQEDAAGQAALDWERLLRTLPLDDLRDTLGVPEDLWSMVIDNDRLAGPWRDLRFGQPVYDRIRVPCLHVTGWFDMEDLVGTFHHYERMMRRPHEEGMQQLVVGPWDHPMVRWPHSDHAETEYGPEAAVDMNAVHLRWYDHWLRDEDNGVERDAAVRVYETGSNRWRQSPAWPLASGRRTLALGAAPGVQRPVGVLRAAEEDPHADPDRSFRYDPEDPVPTGERVYDYGQTDIGLDQTANDERDDVLVYTTEAFDRPLTISGAPRLRLEAASDGTDTDWHVKLSDVDRAGRSWKIAQGCLRAAFRDSLAEPTPLEPGRFYEFVIDLWPVQHTVAAGHRLRVSVTSSDFPWNARNLNEFGALAGQSTPRVATNTVRHRGVSRIELGIEESVPEAAGPNREGRGDTGPAGDNASRPGKVR